MRPRITLRRGIAVIAFTCLLTGAFISILLTKAVDPAPHAATLDELVIPGSWELADTNVAQSLFGSRVERYYLVDADPNEILDPAGEMLAAAGFTLEARRASRDWCDNRPVGATPEITCPTKLIPACWTNGESGPMTCIVSATRGEDRLSIVAFDRSERATYYVGTEQHFVGVPDRIVVRVIVHY